jgi:DNA helicase-2/ATP-dependent DNA helicase PcrA
MNLPLHILNENQLAAVQWTDGPLLVLAGPGSGKTLVLTVRAARLLQDDPDASVLALTFTTKAADKMRENLDGFMGLRADRAHLCTYHSFAGDVLRQHGSHVGIAPDFALLTLDEDRIAVLDDALKSVKEDISTVPSDRKNLLALMDGLFAESYGGESSASSLTQTPVWLPALFSSYCEHLRKLNRLDYGSLLHFAKKLLSENPSVNRMTRLGWKYICVDEFQDTNRAQYDLLRLLVVGEQPNLFVVADDDQIIYQWNGASPERLLALKGDYAMDLVQLPENFRCPPIAITLANNLIRHNKTRSLGKEPLIARKPVGSTDALKAHVFPDEDAEAVSIGKIIKANQWSPEDCAVLARSAKLLERVAQALFAEGFVPFVAQRKNQFECPSVRWMFSMLRLANARHDRELLRRACVEWQAFTDELLAVEAVEAVATLAGGDYLRAWTETAKAKTGSDYFELLGRVGREIVERLNFVGMLEWFWEQKWLDAPLESEEIGTWKELHGALLREHGPENITLHLYLQEMDLKSKAPPRPVGAIPCLTVHGSKGSEFKHVFLIGMADGVFPSFQAVKKGPDSWSMEEERRSCFVAVTRVIETLHISWASSYNGYPKPPSRFLSEMGFTFKTS